MKSKIAKSAGLVFVAASMMWGAPRALAAPAIPQLYDPAEISAILSRKAEAEAAGHPVVLLAHRSSWQVSVSGPRTLYEDQVWLIADASSKQARMLARSPIAYDLTLEQMTLLRARIFRGSDTLSLGRKALARRVSAPPWWPTKECAAPYVSENLALKDLRDGDVLEVAYSVRNRWGSKRYPSSWLRIPFGWPDAPTLERHIVVGVKGGRCQWRTVGFNDAFVRKHRRPIGEQIPEWLEWMSTQHPPVRDIRGTLSEPVVLITRSGSWADVSKALWFNIDFWVRSNTDSLFEEAKRFRKPGIPTRKKAQAVLSELHKRWKRVKGSLLECCYIPRPQGAARCLGCASPLEWALLATSLMRASHLDATIFLARSSSEGFMPDFPTPMQFDRAVIALFVPEENRYVLLDPAQKNLRKAEDAIAQDAILLGVQTDWQEGLYRLSGGMLEVVDATSLEGTQED
ncbi:MAG: hypothetical protein DRH56_08420 [Deltaproteobacteria bacterium]|nr:MAG: hypothetical protein DRH56_08420 [Deltaproteobacteria bacterium]